MPRLAYVNGRFRPLGEAAVGVEDRGFQFADGVYEVWAVLDGRLADFDGHMARLGRSLGELRIRMPMTADALTVALRETVRRNRVRDGLLYLQITRGEARRDHVFPADTVAPTVVMTCKSVGAGQIASDHAGVAVITAPDLRWRRPDIKTTGLLPNVLAKQAAREAGAAEAWLVDAHGYVTEGGSTSAWIVDANGVLRTRGLDGAILPGVTRNTLTDLAVREGLTVEERPFTPEDALAAREAFQTAASAFITPVIRIDGQAIGEGRPGPVSLRLRRLYLEAARAEAV